MNDQIRIEPKGEKFAVVLEHGGSTQEMDVRDTYREAEKFALYLAERVKLDVFYKGHKIVGRKGPQW